MKSITCNACGRDNTSTAFYTSKGIKLRQCKTCWAAYTRQWRNGRIDIVRTQNRENMRRYRWAKLGVDAVRYKEMVSAHGGKCAICSAKAYTKKGGTLAVDHDHKTGKVRGLLCRSCNTLLGQVEDRIEVLRRAIEYLEHHKAMTMGTQ